MRKGAGSRKSKTSTNYKQVSLDDFSDDDSLSDAETGGSDPAQRQMQTLQEQDHGLELLAQATDRLGVMSMAISEELGQQNRMLDDMDEDLETATTNMDAVTRKTKEFIDQSGGTKNFLVILCLSVVVVVLVLLLLYT
ncbi:hypothetical protein MPSEU_000773100 [Mayamaea pseudoterrestris]|nr:hypothetical protein MPSEU_000773100 [Mayamaea pseudoterrestris]